MKYKKVQIVRKLFATILKILLKEIDQDFYFFDFTSFITSGNLGLQQ